MSRKRSGGTTFRLARLRDRTNRLLIGMAAALLVREAWAARTKTAPASAAQTNRVAVSATSGLDLELTRSVYKPAKARDPFLKPGATAIGSNGQNITATLALRDDANTNLGTVAFGFTIGGSTISFTNASFSFRKIE